MLKRLSLIVLAGLLAAFVVSAPASAAGLQRNQWNSLVAVADHTTGSVISSGVVTVPPSISAGVVRLDVPMTGVTSPFNVTTQQVEIDAYASWDGGHTLEQVYAQGAFGSPTGIWGKGLTYPSWQLQVPVNMQGVKADHYEANVVTVSGPISFGLSIFVS